ncbi:MAG: aldehyde dehydrogenase family protein, partial [Cognatishimia sp.]|nr:aldehyde dehydrogenase family protein [Cognatishimia sp.]
GASEIANINPSDLSDTIGMYAQADSAQLQQALKAANGAQSHAANGAAQPRGQLNF